MKSVDLFAPVAPPSWLVPLSVGALGSLILTAVYVGLVALAESPARALEQWWGERAFNVPIVLGFGLQLGLYTVLRRGRSVARAAGGAVGAAPAASGSASTLAMVACCAHRVADLLPIVGVGAAATLLASWKEPLLWLAVFSNLAGVVVLAITLYRRRRVLRPAGMA